MVELVLGGEGLIGSELSHLLRDNGHRVVSIDLKNGCDLRTVSLDPFKDCDRVWFLAWDVGGAKYLGAADKQHQIFTANCELSVRVFDALEKTRKPFLFTTTQLAGQQTAYGYTKLMAEHWARELGGKVARLWNTYGWQQPGIRSHVITDMVMSGLTTGRVKCLTNGNERRRFIYKSDCAAALVRLCDGPERNADVAGSDWLTIRQVAEEVAGQLGTEVDVGDIEGQEVMIDPCDILAGWKPVIPLREGVHKVVLQARRFLTPKDS